MRVASREGEGVDDGGVGGASGTSSECRVVGFQTLEGKIRGVNVIERAIAEKEEGAACAG